MKTTSLTTILRRVPLALALSMLFLTAEAQQASPASPEFDHGHALFAQVLRSHVDEAGMVDYAGLAKGNRELRAYLDAAAAVPQSRFDAWTEEQRLAFLLNVYNAATLALVAEHHPVKSIKQIGGLFRSPWKLSVVRLWGGEHSLDWLEHEVIRGEDYDEPRIHFALVCAAVGCPPLRTEPYLAARLDEQLEEQARRFLSDRGKNRYVRTKGVLHLSPIFKWYGGDFASDESALVAVLTEWLPAADAERVRKADSVQVEWTDYDWSLNEQTIGEAR